MKIKLFEKFVILLLLLICLILIKSSIAKYINLFDRSGNGVIAEPIIVLEKDEVVDKYFDKRTDSINYLINIKNYTDEKINEVGFTYNLEILESNNDFPIDIKLIDLNTNEEVELNDNKTQEYLIGVNSREDHRYLLNIDWKNKDTNYSDNLRIDLKANIVQLYN